MTGPARSGPCHPGAQEVCEWLAAPASVRDAKDSDGAKMERGGSTVGNGAGVMPKTSFPLA